jgi:hypothetical protein
MGQHSFIKTFEQVFSDQDRERIQNYLKSPNWCYGQYSHKTKEQHKKFWYMELMEHRFFCSDLFEKICVITKSKFSLLKVYANGHTFAQDGYWHMDTEKNDEYTFLYYANPEWKVTWAGETVFNIDNTILSFVPKPNTALLFPGNIWHYAKSPSRDFFDLRTTIAFKMKLEN